MEAEEEWTFWAGTDESLDEWMDPWTYPLYSIDLEQLRLTQGEEFSPPASRMIMEGEPGGMLFGRACPSSNERRKWNEMKVRKLIKAYKFQQFKEQIKTCKIEQRAREFGFLGEPRWMRQSFHW